MVKEKRYFASNETDAQDGSPAEVQSYRDRGVAPNQKVPWIRASSQTLFESSPADFGNESKAGGEDHGYIADTRGTAGSNPATRITLV